MSQVSLINKSGIVIKANDFVKINPADPDHLSFLYADYWEAEIMGTATHNCAPGKKCVIELLSGGTGSITGDSNIDGGSAASIYLPNQLIDGGNV